MNILHRIKKLETQTDGNKPFCECFNEYRRKMIESVYAGKTFDESGENLPSGDYCRKCRKPVNIEFEQKMERDFLLIYGDL